MKMEINFDLTKKQKQIALAGVALTLMIVGGGIWASKANKNNSTNNNPNQTPIEEQQTNIPKEAQSFVEQYGNIYGANTVSTYYAEKAYEDANSDKSLILSEEYIKNYVPIEVKGGEVPQISDHGFTYLELPKSEKIDGDLIVKLFNGYMGPSLELYMNLLAKNPNQKARDIIDTEFTNYCSSGALAADDEYMNILMNTTKDIVSRNGSNVNYKIVPLTSDINSRDDQSLSYILPAPDTWTQNWYKGQSTDAFSDAANRIVINTTKYNSNDDIQKDKITACDFQMTFTRQITPDQISNSRVSIGITDIVKIYPTK